MDSVTPKSWTSDKWTSDPWTRACLLMQGASLSGRAIRRLLAFDDVHHRLLQEPAAMCREAGLTEKMTGRLLERHRHGFIDREAHRIQERGIRLCALGRPGYPPSLLSITDPPLVLYQTGAVLDLPTGVAVVGSRRCTTYGKRQARRVGRLLATQRIPAISGLARGIDQCAHLGALEDKGNTIAILGCGLDRLYPPEARDLFERVKASGWVGSEHPLGTPPLRENFPRRNRIISGLARVVVVIEAATKSGSLITAHHAMEQSRDVMAVPGPIDVPTSQGCNELIRDGAHPLLSSEDLLGLLGVTKKKAEEKKPPEMSAIEQKIFDQLQVEPLDCDALCDRTGLDLAEVMEALWTLTEKGLVESIPGAAYART